MKLITLLFLLNTFILFGQNDECTFYLNSNEEKIYSYVTIEAIPKIQDANLTSYFVKNIIYDSVKSPDGANCLNTIIKIVISSDGKIIDKKILKIGFTGLAEQMFIALDKIKWEPATCGDKKVNSEQIIPLRITLE